MSRGRPVIMLSAELHVEGERIAVIARLMGLTRKTVYSLKAAPAL